MLVADLHVHTLASSHAFCTVRELFAAAAEAGLKAMALTDHGPGLPDAPHLWHFETMYMLPDSLCDVRLLRGVEANLLDFDGRLDLPDGVLGRLDFVIASMHGPCLRPGTAKEHTEAWLRIAHNPLVDCLGHSGQSEYPYDYKAVVRACRDTGCILEINNHSFFARPGSNRNCRDIAACCAEQGVPVVVNTDAHWAGQVGHADGGLDMLREIDFPEELILNTDFDRLSEWFWKRKKIKLCISA